MKKQIATLNLTPKWIDVLPILVTVIKDGNIEGQKSAVDQLRIVCKFADEMNDELSKERTVNDLYIEFQAGLKKCFSSDSEYYINERTNFPVLHNFFLTKQNKMHVVFTNFERKKYFNHIFDFTDKVRKEK